MTFKLNPELAAQLTALTPRLEQLPAYQLDDVMSWRRKSDAFYALVNTLIPAAEKVIHTDVPVALAAQTLRARWYRQAGEMSAGAVLFVHGGGGVSASVAQYDKIVSNYVAQSGVSFFSLDYELAPEVAGAVQALQVFEALLWLKENASQFGVDPQRIVLMGDSGGGGIAASAAILARDRGVHLAGQILVYPMLDDRTAEAIAATAPFLSITASEMQLLWRARIPVGASQLPQYSPARLTDFRGMPPTYLDVGELDLFCLEGLVWTTQLAAAGVPVEFHLYSGVNHGFELLAPESGVARQAMGWRCGAIRRLTGG